MADVSLKKIDLEKTKDELKNFILQNFLFGQEEININSDDSFLESGIIDSTGILELVTFIEENYSVEVADEEMLPENLDSLNNVAKFVVKKQVN
jgi:acyl carrier protein